MISLSRYLDITFIETERRNMLSWGRGRENGELVFKGIEVYFGEIKMFW